MALTPLTKGGGIGRDIASYDLEWIPGTYRLRLIGVRDARGYRSYTDFESFFSSEFVWSTRGRTFFAHFGGRFDVQVLRPHFARAGIRAKFIISGSGAPIVKLTRGLATWVLADTGALFRYSLRKLGKAVGIEKGDLTPEEMATCAISVLREYNQTDCEIVWVAVQKLFDALDRLGGPFRLTSGSMALALFRKQHLRETIQTSRIDNRIVSASYYASRIEPWAQRIDPSPELTWGEYDINSSFPASMARAPLPGALIGVSEPHGAYVRKPDAYTISRVRIEIPDDIAVPPIPTRVRGRMFFPVGNVTGYYTSDDIEHAISRGCSVTAAGDCHSYELTNAWADCVLALWDLRKAAIADGDLFLAEALKIVINSLYGKTSEREEKECVEYMPETTQCRHDGAHDTPDGASCMRHLGGGYWAIKDTTDVPHAHVAAGSATTARARIALALVFEACLSQIPRSVAYGDTDGVQTCATLPTGSGLGELKRSVHSWQSALFIAPKMYALLGVDKDGSGKLSDIYKGKGFSRLDYERFSAVARGEKIDVVRMAGLLESDWSKGPTDTRVSKGIGKRDKWGTVVDYACGVCGARAGYGNAPCKACRVGHVLPVGARPKRCFTADGFSRAWHSDELAED